MASRKFTQESLVIKLNISKSSLHNYCNGVHPRNLETLKKIADFFEISLNELIFGEKIEVVGVNFVGDIEGEYMIKIVKNQTPSVLEKSTTIMSTLKLSGTTSRN